MAVRIILMSISQHAARSKRYIVPYMSCSIDFYCRVFVRVYTSANEVKKTASKHSYVYNCTGCEAYSLQKVARSECKGNSVKYKAGSGPPVPPKCVHCDRPHQIGGPIYSDPIHDPAFVAGLLKDVEATEADNKYGTFKRMQGFLSVISEELPDSPLYWTAPAMCNKVHCSTMSLLQVRSAILNAGYKVSGSHANKDALKTDAPAEFMWDVIRSWCKLNPVSRKNENSPGFALLSREIKTEANFEQHKDANPPSRFLGVKRFQENPLPNWGPKSRAKKPQLPPKRPNADAEEPAAKKPTA
jgi:tRNA (guanine26-N2/guanine27-N2)-dimethyltransferase